MSRKTQACYEALFKFLHDNVLPLTCNSFMTDYERAMGNALQTLYPDSDFYHCWFHFSQALRRRCSTYKTFYKNIKKNPKAVKCYLKLRALPLLPAVDIIEAFNLVKAEINTLPERIHFATLLEYYEKQWLKKVNK